MRKKRTLHGRKRNKTARSKKGGFLLRWLRDKISRNRDKELGRKHRSMKNESEKWYHRYNPFKLFTRRQKKDYSHLFEKKNHPSSHKHERHYYKQDNFNEPKREADIDYPKLEPQPYPFEKPQEHYQDEAKSGPSDLFSRRQPEPFEKPQTPKYPDEVKRGHSDQDEVKRGPSDQPIATFWKAYKGGKWVNVTRDELTSIEEYRKKEIISVGSGAFIATFSHVPLSSNSSNTEYVSRSIYDGEEIHFKYDPTDDQRPSSNKERKWLVRIGGVIHKASDHQIEAVTKYRDKIISFFNPDGILIENKFSTVDTPGQPSIYVYVTEQNNIVNMIYAEKEETERPKGFGHSPVSVEMKVPPYTNAIELYNLYLPGYAPPRWALEPKYSNPSSLEKVQIYSTSEWGEALQQCIMVREPVNIKMWKGYSNPFDSGYTAWFKKHGTLAPNLAVYAECIMSMDGRDLEHSIEERQLTDPKLVHVFNSIGFAFDNELQPDYEYYLPLSITSEKSKELLDDFTNVLLLFLTCAKNRMFPNLCFCYLGGSEFKKKYEERGFKYIDLFVQALDNAFDKIKEKRFENVYFVGRTRFEQVDSEKIYSILVKYKLNKLIDGNIGFVGDIPEVFEELDTENTLFMNAWDPHSVVGNGNESDRSLDGWFGRLSNLALLCTPATNPAMLRPEAFVHVEV